MLLARASDGSSGILLLSYPSLLDFGEGSYTAAAAVVLG
jgi:hypothetical protein